MREDSTRPSLAWRTAGMIAACAACLPDTSSILAPEEQGIFTWVLVDDANQLARAPELGPFSSIATFEPELALGWACDAPSRLGLTRSSAGWVSAGDPIRIPDSWWDRRDGRFQARSEAGELSTFALSPITPCVRLSEERDVLMETADYPRLVAPFGGGVLVVGSDLLVELKSDGTRIDREGLPDVVAAALVEDELWVVTHRSPRLEIVHGTLDVSSRAHFESIFEWITEKPCGLEQGEFALVAPPARPVDRLYLVTFDAAVIELTRTGTTWRSSTLRTIEQGERRACKTEPSAIWVAPEGVATVSGDLDAKINIFTPRGPIVESVPSVGVTTQLIQLPGKGIAVGDTAGGVFLRRAPGEFDIVETGDISQPPIGLLAPFFGDGLFISAAGGGGTRQWFEGHGVCTESPSEFLPPLIWLLRLGDDLVGVPSHSGDSVFVLMRLRQVADICRPHPL
ncbi:MAG: hypothetical protein HY791_09040 [Deltaproteobacteria bacterium]|nr:hypothetical protein [Deltaproteobacteria bacterium]